MVLSFLLRGDRSNERQSVLRQLGAAFWALPPGVIRAGEAVV